MLPGFFLSYPRCCRLILRPSELTCVFFCLLFWRPLFLEPEKNKKGPRHEKMMITIIVFYSLSFSLLAFRWEKKQRKKMKGLCCVLFFFARHVLLFAVCHSIRKFKKKYERNHRNQKKTTKKTTKKNGQRPPSKGAFLRISFCFSIFR